MVFKTLRFEADLRTGRPAILKPFIFSVLVSEFSEVKTYKPFSIEVNQHKRDAKNIDTVLPLPMQAQKSLLFVSETY
jgi:hypothetical protein